MKYAVRHQKDEVFGDLLWFDLMLLKLYFWKFSGGVDVEYKFNSLLDLVKPGDFRRVGAQDCPLAYFTLL